mmetsp:Transcript_15917/g.17676  ORF Transcript_15917/g.17676 Transcript_15917/m.17676 type:complete len:312 (-) Transcript_15917:45-980(-)
MTLEQKEMSMFKKSDPTQNFKSFRKQGQGGFGTVECAKHKKSKTVIAIKKVKHETLKQKEHNLQEIEFLKRLRGVPNIVKYYATYRVGNELWMIMEFLEGGTLTRAITTWSFTDLQIAYILRALVKGLQRLHSSKIVHRDLKPSNIMLSVYGDVKIIDFGMAIDLEYGSIKERTHMVGSGFWMSPEMIRKEPISTGVDIFALGLITCGLIEGKEFYYSRSGSSSSQLEIMFNTAIKGPPNFRQYKKAKGRSESLFDFVEKCTTIEPHQRATSDDLIIHPFLANCTSKVEMTKLLKTIFLNSTLTNHGLLGI